ncbi:unnamed protein product [Arabidopsis halleri]
MSYRRREMLNFSLLVRKRRRGFLKKEKIDFHKI